MYAHIEIDSTTETVREPNSNDEWDRGETHTEWSVGDVFIFTRSRDAGPGVDLSGYECTPITFEPEAGQIAFLLYAVYDTGCSFGTDEGGGFDVIGVFEDENEAWAAYRQLQNVTNQDGPVTISIGGNEVTYSAPWTGYFEQLKYLEVKPVICKD